MLEQYNRAMPDGAHRIVAMAEEQVRHRHTLESRVVNGNVAAQTRGQYFAFILGFVAIAGGIGLIAFDKNALGLAVIAGALVSLTAVFVVGRKQQEQERERKRQELKMATENPRLPFGQD